MARIPFRPGPPTPSGRLARALILLAAAALVPISVGAQDYQVLHSFTGVDGDGAGPRGTLVQVGNNFYGTTWSGGAAGGFCANGCGTVFKLDCSGPAAGLHAPLRRRLLPVAPRRLDRAAVHRRHHRRMPLTRRST